MRGEVVQSSEKGQGGTVALPRELTRPFASSARMGDQGGERGCWGERGAMLERLLIGGARFGGREKEDIHWWC